MEKIFIGMDVHASKIYTKINDGQWKMIRHTGLLKYDESHKSNSILSKN
jgi:hypothetical protein